MEIGTATWFDLPVSDLLDAMSFYEALLGWQFVKNKDTAEFSYVMIRVGDALIGGLRQSESPTPAAPESRTPVLYFTVDRLTPKLARAKELGAKLIGETVDIGGNRGHYQWLRDRADNVIALWAETR